MNDPHDAGGETNFGISKRQYPNLDIKNLTKQQAADIYKRDYYAKVKGDSMPAWLALLLRRLMKEMVLGAIIRAPWAVSWLLFAVILLLVTWSLLRWGFWVKIWLGSSSRWLMPLSP